MSPGYLFFGGARTEIPITAPPKHAVDVWKILLPSELYSATGAAPIGTKVNPPALLREARDDRKDVVATSILLKRTIVRQLLELYRSSVPVAAKTAIDLQSRGYESDRLYYNYSSSGSRLFLATSKTGPVGIDVERMDQSLEWRNIAYTAFNEHELHWIEDNRTEQIARFFRIWTLREAMFKAWGVGLHDGMKSISTVSESKISCTVMASKQRRWWIESLPLFDNYASAIATAFRVQAVREISLHYSDVPGLRNRSEVMCAYTRCRGREQGSIPGSIRRPGHSGLADGHG